MSMKKGEHAVLVCKPEYAYGASGAGADIPPNATLNFDVELLDYTEQLDVESMTIRERIDAAAKYKEEGNVAFKSQNYMLAITQYEKGVTLVQFARKNIIDDDNYETLTKPTEAENEEALTLLQSLRTNKAICLLKTNDFPSAIKECDLVLKEDPKNIKALYRRACARCRFGLLQDAKKDLSALLALDPNNKSALAEMETVNRMIANDDKRTKRSLHSLFTKGGLYSEKANVVSTDFAEDDPTVFFDVKQGDEMLGRIEMRLYSHVVGEERTCEV